MDKQIEYIHVAEYYLVLKRSGILTHATYNMDESWENTKHKRPAIKSPHSIWFRIYEMSRMATSLETESRLVVARGWGRMGSG